MSSKELESLEGIGKSTAKTLIENGIVSIEGLATCTVPRLQAIGIGKVSARKYIKAAQESCDGIYGFVTGAELKRQFKKRQYLTSGITALDSILYHKKGFQTQKTYEIYGPEGTGKSTLLHQLIVTAFLPPDKGGLGAGTIYIDCEGTFSIDKINLIAPRFGVDPDEVAENVSRSYPATSEALVHVCRNKLAAKAQETGARLICLDSIATHFRTEYGQERQLFPKRQQDANKVIHALKDIATQVNGVAILTNQVTANVNMRPGQRKFVHSMGNTVGHESQVRLLIRKISRKTGLCTIEVEKALDLAPRTCEVYQGPLGLTDEKQEEIEGIEYDDEEEEAEGDDAPFEPAVPSKGAKSKPSPKKNAKTAA